MAPFEWITSEKVMKTWGILGGLLFIGLGIGTLWLALVHPSEVNLFGVDVYVLLGVGQIAGGAFFLVLEYLAVPDFSKKPK